MKFDLHRLNLIWFMYFSSVQLLLDLVISLKSSNRFLLLIWCSSETSNTFRNSLKRTSSELQISKKGNTHDVSPSTLGVKIYILFSILTFTDFPFLQWMILVRSPTWKRRNMKYSHIYFEKNKVLAFVTLIIAFGEQAERLDLIWSNCKDILYISFHCAGLLLYVINFKIIFP